MDIRRTSYMKYGLSFFALFLVACQLGCGGPRGNPGDLIQNAKGRSATCAGEKNRPSSFVGSAGCRECHARFHELWATSYHGLAMQPFTQRLAREKLTPLDEEIRIHENYYRVDLVGGLSTDGTARLLERGPDGEKKYEIQHALGGKNVYYFLTSSDRGRLQVLPLAYDVRRRQWYDTTASAVRHFSNRSDEAVDWHERDWTFNVSCYHCHVSQLSTNYDAKKNCYNTIWGEPGINCETCHGSAKEHIRVCREAAATGTTPSDLKLTVVAQNRGFSSQQVNTTCAPCHAKMVPISKKFQPGDRYFDHFDLVGFEHPDFYPDGRDLGENYTYTLWRMNPCAKSGKLDCLHCHTSSGRYRHKDNPNQSCMPCHSERVANVVAHSHHAADSPGSRCIACHMPMTEFARMRRSDHSMLPPTPAATIQHQSPNACNLCHKDQDAAWSDRFVRQWHQDDYQMPVLHRAGLVDAARKQDWSRLGDMLDYLKSKDREEITAASLVKLLAHYPQAKHEGKKAHPVILECLQNDPSPLVRAAAAGVMGDNLDRSSFAALLGAIGDDYRLVRIRAAAALANIPAEIVPVAARSNLDQAVAEFEEAMQVRPDDSASHHNLGNFHMGRRQFSKAVEAFERSSLLDPRSIQPLVNASLAHSALGKNQKAEAVLRHALVIEPDNAAANFNLGLLLGELNRKEEAEKALRNAIKADPKLSAAAFNLGVILAAEKPDESIRWCKKAVTLSPNNAKYVFTLAFYQDKTGSKRAAIKTLLDAVNRRAVDVAVYALLGSIYQKHNENNKAAQTYLRAATDTKLTPDQRRRFHTMARFLKSD